MSDESGVPNHGTFADNMVNQEGKKENSDHQDAVEKLENNNSEEVLHFEDDGIKIAEDKDHQSLKKINLTSSNTMALLAATYASTDPSKTETIEEDDTKYITVDDDSSSTASSHVGTRSNAEQLEQYGIPSSIFLHRPSMKGNSSSSSNHRAKRRKTRLREKARMLLQKKADKREQLKVEVERRIALGLDVEDLMAKPLLPPPPQVKSIFASDNAGYVKGKYRFRGDTVKRPSSYDPQALFEWSALNDEERREREKQKRLDFQKEQRMIELKRKKNKKAKKIKLASEEVVNIDPISSSSTGPAEKEPFLNPQSSSNQDVKILKVVKKSKEKPSASMATSSIIPQSHLRISLEEARKRNKLRLIRPAAVPVTWMPPGARPPVVCFPRPRLHTIPPFRPRPPVIRKPFTDECFSAVPCSTPSSTTSSSVTVAPPVFSTTSRRVQMKKQAALHNAMANEEETVFDECFTSVPCSKSSTTKSSAPIRQQSPFNAKHQPNASFTNHQLVLPQVPINTTTAHILPQTTMITVPHSTTITVPSSQPTLISQFSTFSGTTSTTSTAAISAPIQLTQQAQIITIPSSMLPPPGTPLQLVFVIPPPSNNNNNINSSGPIMLQQQQPSPSSNDTNMVQVKTEIKE